MRQHGISDAPGADDDPADRAYQGKTHFSRLAAICWVRLARELKMLTQLTGSTDVHNLDVDDLRALDYNTSLVTGVKLVGTN